MSATTLCPDGQALMDGTMIRLEDLGALLDTIQAIRGALASAPVS